MKSRNIHFRITEELLERFERAVEFEGVNKTEFLTYAILKVL